MLLKMPTRLIVMFSYTSFADPLWVETGSDNHKVVLYFDEPGYPLSFGLI